MSSWSHLLTDTITYALRSGSDGNGDPTFAAKATAPARAEGSYTLNRVSTNHRWMSKDPIATEADIAVGSRVWPPGATTTDNNQSLLVRERRYATSPLTGDILYELVL